MGFNWNVINCHGNYNIGRNPYTGEQYLIAAIPKGIMLLQWFQPRHIFMMVKVGNIRSYDAMLVIVLHVLYTYVPTCMELPASY